MLALLRYRLSGGGLFSKISKPLEKRLMKENTLKLYFIFAAFYFSCFIIYSHSGIGCEDLDLDAQCECYALEVRHRDNIKQKLHWANNGQRMCPDSEFFSKVIEENS